MVGREPLGAREVAIIRRIKDVLKVPITQIAKVVDRNKTQVYRALDKSWKSHKRGRREVLSGKDATHLVRTLKDMQKKALAKQEISLAMLMKRAKCRACDRVVRNALQSRGIRFRRMREKPILTKDDKQARFDFAKRYRSKSRAWWLQNVHLHIDVKNFPAYVHAAARDVAAMRSVRGAYRAAGQGLDEAYVVMPKNFRYNPGVRSVKILGGVGNGSVHLWHSLDKMWNGSVAADCYKTAVIQSLRRAWPGKKVFRVLEDNDPTGFKSRAGEAAKRAVGIKVFEIPKRSPDLNVCDYALWAAVNRKMRRQERLFPRSKRESRQEFIDRLRRVARGLPRAFVEGCIGDMKRRCQLLYESRGGLFEEGGCSHRT
jgi:hypothetical protein